MIISSDVLNGVLANFGLTRPLTLLGRAGLRKLTKLKGDNLKASQDIAPQSRNILQTFVWSYIVWVRACPQYTNAKNKIRRFAELYMNLSWSFQQITFENGFSANFKTVLSRRISPNWSQSKVEIGREWGGKRKREKGEGKRAFLPNLLAISLSQATSYHFRRPLCRLP